MPHLDIAKLMNMATESPQSAFILKLSQELLEHVVSFFEPRSALLNFRATCKELCRKTEQVVAREFFSDVKFLIANERSLRTLVEISKHPVFSMTMDTISFSFAKELDRDSEDHDRLDGWDQKNHDDEVRAAALTVRKSHGRLALQFDKDVRPVIVETPVAQDVKDHHAECRQLLADRIELRDSLKDVEYLRSALFSFKAAGRTPALVAGGLDFTSSAFHKRAIGYGQASWAARGPAGDAWNFDADPGDVRSFEVIMEAICDINYPVTHLELGCKDFGMLLLRNESIAAKLVTQHHLPERLLPKGFLRLSFAFENLTVLKIAIEQRPTNRPYSLVITRSHLMESLKHLITFLRQPKNLEVFGLTHACSEQARNPEHFIFTTIVEELTSDIPDQERALRNIRELELCEIKFEQEDLLAFVRATRSTLRTLRIDDGEWRTFMGALTTRIASRWRKMIQKELGEPMLLTLVGNLFWPNSDTTAFLEYLHVWDLDSEDYDEEEDDGSSLDDDSEDSGMDSEESEDEADSGDDINLGGDES